MSRYTVVLEMRYHGSACGSTDDIIEAHSEQEAVEIAMREWKRVEPRFTYGVLFSAPATCRRSATLLGQLSGQP